MFLFTIFFFFFFFNDTATTEIYTLSLHDALPILIITCYCVKNLYYVSNFNCNVVYKFTIFFPLFDVILNKQKAINIDRKSTRLNSSHLVISYAVFCLKKKNKIQKLYIIVKQIYDV